MSSGSGLFSKEAPVIPHQEQGHGVKNEVGDLRADVGKVFTSLAAIGVDEFVNPAAGGAALLKAATATVASAVTLKASDLLAPGIAILAAFARNLTFTTAGTTPANAPATATITGTVKNASGTLVKQTEVVNLATTAATATGVKVWNTITSIVYAAAGGTAATISIGIGNLLGLGRSPKTRAGLCAPSREIAAGALVTTGAFVAANRSYAPATVPDGTKSYCVYYEYDPLVP